MIRELAFRKKVPGSFFDALKSGTVICLEIRPGGVNHLTARHKDYVHRFRRRMGPEQLARESFRPVAGHGVPHLGAGRDAQTGRFQAIRQGETGHEPAPQLQTPVEHPGELRPPTQFVRITAQTRP